MDSSRFSSLIYRIIGKPEGWQDEYVDTMNQLIDETESLDDPVNFSELAVGDQILSRMRDTNEALTAFNALLDKSRFKMMILDGDFKPIYHNQTAKQLHDSLLCPKNPNVLNSRLLAVLKDTKLNVKSGSQTNSSGIMAIDYTLSGHNSQTSPSHRAEDDAIGEQIYLRSINAFSQFNVLLVLDQSRQQSALNSELITRYELTDKEQMVLIKLIHGKSIKSISNDSFVSENTVKTHLKSLFRKTDTKSQTDLVGLVLTHESQILDSYFATSPGAAASVEDRQMILNDGTKIVYREYGPRDGYPIIVCHNGYGCRMTIPNNYETICRKHKRRIIIPDRPGFGQTPFVAGHPKRWTEQLNEFITELGIKKYDMLGNVLGCPIAIDFAAQADHRLKHLILSSPIFINTKEDAQYMLGVLSVSTRFVSASERFARRAYELWLKSITLNLGSHYRNMVETSFGEAERDIFAQHNTLDLLVNSFREGSSISLDGIVSEMVHHMSPRNLDLSQITVPVSLWWGTEDIRVSREGVLNLAAQLKDSTVHLKEGYSEHIYFALFEEIISSQ